LEAKKREGWFRKRKKGRVKMVVDQERKVWEGEERKLAQYE